MSETSKPAPVKKAAAPKLSDEERLLVIKGYADDLRVSIRRDDHEVIGCDNAKRLSMT
jgi:hypothetical protein